MGIHIGEFTNHVTLENGAETEVDRGSTEVQAGQAPAPSGTTPPHLQDKCRTAAENYDD